jgi:hypothetical protein
MKEMLTLHILATGHIQQAPELILHTSKRASSVPAVSITVKKKFCKIFGVVFWS